MGADDAGAVQGPLRGEVGAAGAEDERPAAVFFKQAPVPELGHGGIPVFLQLTLVHGVLFGPAQHIALGAVPLRIDGIDAAQ